MSSLRFRQSKLDSCIENLDMIFCPLNDLALPLLLILNQEQNAIIMIATKSLTIKTQFVAGVEFGMPSKKCKNFGICRIHPIGEYKKTCTCNKQDVLAVVTVYNAGYVEIEFLRNNISAADYNKYFSSGKFKVDEDYLFIGMDDKEHHFKVAKGQYSVIETLSIIKVIFR